jgi:sugar lactone lactonase YvrE
MEIRTLAEGLGFPEGPVALTDGSVLLVEIFAGTLTRVSPDGTKTIVARPGGGPQRRSTRAGRQMLRLQQRRLQMAHRGVAPATADAGR